MLYLLCALPLHSADATPASVLKMMGRRVSTLMSAQAPIPARSAVSTRTAASTVCAWRVTSLALKTPLSANQLRVRNATGLTIFWKCLIHIHSDHQIKSNPNPADEEPFLIFANRYYLRKLNLDGSNYTLLKQVRNAYNVCLVRELMDPVGFIAGPH